MDLLGHCTWCKQPITGDYVADSEGSREHEWCHGLRMKQERNDAREQLRGAVEERDALRELLRDARRFVSMADATGHTLVKIDAALDRLGGQYEGGRLTKDSQGGQ